MSRIHKDNMEVVKKHPHIVVYSFTEGGMCPNCLSQLKLNEFGNYICERCWRNCFLRDGRHRFIREMEDE